MYALLFSDISNYVAYTIYTAAKNLKVAYYSEYNTNHNQNCVVGLVTKGDADTIAKLCTDKTKITILKEV